jgi:F0F1-type ATP synthase assembly protein I
VSQNQQSNQVTLIAGVIGQVGCLVVLLVGLALGVGMLIDRFLGTDGLFTVLLMLGSVPATLYLTVRVSMAAAKRAQEYVEQQSKSSSTEKEDNA